MHFRQCRGFICNKYPTSLSPKSSHTVRQIGILHYSIKVVAGYWAILHYYPSHRRKEGRMTKVIRFLYVMGPLRACSHKGPITYKVGSAAPAFLSARALPAGTGDVRPEGANPSSLSARRDEIPVREVSETTGDGLIGLSCW